MRYVEHLQQFTQNMAKVLHLLQCILLYSPEGVAERLCEKDMMKKYLKLMDLDLQIYSDIHVQLLTLMMTLYIQKQEDFM